MNITERISTFLHHKDTSRKHPGKRTIGIKDLLTSFGFVGLELVAAGLLAACGETQASVWAATYCDRGADGKQPPQDCHREQGNGPTCPATIDMWYKTYRQEPSTCQVNTYPLPQP